MLLLLRNRPLTWLKIAASTTRPSTAGSAPGSPDRRRSTYERAAPATVRRSTSREKSPAGRPVWAAPPAVSGLVLGVVMARPSDALVGRRRSQPDVTAAAGGDQLDNLRGAAVLRLDDGGDAPEVEGGDAVGDLHDVVHVVRDQDDAQALVGEAADEGEHLTRLRDTEGRRRLVEKDHLAVPQHGFRDGDRLALPARQTGDRLAH